MPVDDPAGALPAGSSVAPAPAVPDVEPTDVVQISDSDSGKAGEA